MNSDIKAESKAQRATKEWFWRAVMAGVICDFLYLGWLLLRSLQAQ
jgi:hypothetical protein